jgi:hypothetical protein
VSNFSLAIDGIDCSKVVRIDGFVIPQATVGSDGVARVDFPDLKVTFQAVTAATWLAWLESFLVQNHNSDADERHGTLRILGVNGVTVLATIELDHIGIRRLTQVPTPEDGIAKLAADLYVEKMSLSVP